MITFKAIIIPNNRRKDGTYPVKIRVTFKGVTRRLPTTLVCKQTDITRGNKIKNADILSKSDELINRMRAAVRDLSPFDLQNHDVDWVVSKIRESLSGESFRLSFFEWGAKFLGSKDGATKRVYQSSMRAFARFLGTDKLDINDISRTMLLDFVEFYDNEPRVYYNQKKQQYLPCANSDTKKSSSSRHLSRLHTIFNAAKSRYNDEDSGRILIPRSPFDSITKVFPISNGQKNLGEELMQKIISAQVSTEAERIALDLFIVSFGTMGANLTDLYFATPVDGCWVYNRQKTRNRRADHAEMRVKIAPQIEPFIARLQGCRSGWWLSKLHEFSRTKDTCSERVNRALKRWCEANGVPAFTFYAARHTWASLARKAGVEKATIDECLAHKGDYSITDIYAERDWDLINQANEKVLNLFKWE